MTLAMVTNEVFCSVAVGAQLEVLVAAVRRFNRFYTSQIGLLQEALYDSPFSLTEVRVLYELAHRVNPTASEIGDDLELDAGYLSRILRRFEKSRLVQKRRSSADARQSHLSLTKRGKQAFAPLDARSNQQVATLLAKLSPAKQKGLVSAMQVIGHLLGSGEESGISYVLRAHQPGDMGWVTERHGSLYWQEYGYDERFEALVAGIVSKFIEHLDARRERCWIAEQDGERVGCIFLVKKSKVVAKLRLLLVEASARGQGIGKRLVTECVNFARQAGYKKIVLWTQSELHAARHLYEQAGFRRVHQEKHDSWSRKGLVAEVWELTL
jgi:DNA-binding MarR family transcriptional regulator/N-acetylglutamate synthase-like GNAT family acetyltransferase